MKNAKKVLGRFAALVLCLALAMSMAACGNDTAGDTTPATGNPADNGTTDTTGSADTTEPTGTTGPATVYSVPPTTRSSSRSVIIR